MTPKTIANCPECGGALSFADVAIIGENMIVNGYDSVAECPRCGIQWEWAKSGELQVRQGEQEYTTFGDRRPKFERVCPCGCGEKFRTTHKDKHYLNNAHRSRGVRKGMIVDDKKRNVRSRERMN